MFERRVNGLIDYWRDRLQRIANIADSRHLCILPRIKKANRILQEQISAVLPETDGGQS